MIGKIAEQNSTNQFFYWLRLLFLKPKSVNRQAVSSAVSPGTLGLSLLKLVFLKPQQDHHPSDLSTVNAWFPQIDFNRFELLDIVRFPLQLIWIVVVVILGTFKQHAFRKDPAVVHKKRNYMPEVYFLAQKLKRRHGHGGRRESYQRQGKKMLDRLGQKLIDYGDQLTFFDTHLKRVMAIVVLGFFALLIISTPFSSFGQSIFVILMLMLSYVIRNSPGRVVNMIMISLSVIISTRYMWWRFSVPLNSDKLLDFTWGIVLLAAETYAYIFMLFGYLQSGWLMRRKIIPLPDDQSRWPTVDVFIPTYNEPLDIIQTTVYGAMRLDWPSDKFKIYLLDDGHRDDFKTFAQEQGIEYLSRPSNEHAKAGNLNYALQHSQGDLVAIFDCDHVPTRSFLQVTVGGFLQDQKLFLVQTPHQFYSADPFEKNLGNFRMTPNESELFYGLVQKGNDFWNASFFCGSCAVLRREMLLEVGGIAVNTVTEDAHTSLKLHRLGYHSHYLGIPQAAGLSTETLADFLGQRMRWARGMAQIFRMDNPFLGSGLSLMQRICYSTAMLNFLSGIPRLVFLTAPLGFLFFHAYLILAPVTTVLLYVLPHMIHAMIAKTRTQDGLRSNFFSEVYETVLSWYIIGPTTMALIDPAKGKFNVTSKEGGTYEDFFDFRSARPYLIIIVLNMLGIAIGFYRASYGPVNELFSVVMNMGWCVYNCLMLGCALFVASEIRQSRVKHRVQVSLDVSVLGSDGKCFVGKTQDFSEGGAAILLGEQHGVQRLDTVWVSFSCANREKAFPCQVLTAFDNGIRIQWIFESESQRREYIQYTFGQASIWLDWSDHIQMEHPFSGVFKLFSVGALGYFKMIPKIPGIPLSIGVTRRVYDFIWSVLPKTPKHLKYLWR